MPRENFTCRPKKSGSQALIAIVDDEESVCNALSRLMRSVGFLAATFSSGRQFMAWSAERRPDCVVLDVHMPQPDGIEIHTQLQSAMQGANVPIILITGHDTPEISEIAIEQGVHACLRKPVDDVLLLAAINAALAGSAPCR
ncbi:MAG: response regulator transcription factor [Burkholderiales bacterium]